jgi:hypothetical protein
LLATKGRRFNYVCREILEFLDFGSADKERRSSVFSRPSDFIDDFMVKMEDQLMHQDILFEEAFIPGSL